MSNKARYQRRTPHTRISVGNYSIGDISVLSKNKDALLRQELHQVTPVSYPDKLPVSREVANIKQLILNNQVVVICGETGSGKTTQLPKILFELGMAKHGIIGHTQPRKVAAKSLAKRIGEELKNSDLVGYKFRFHDRTRPETCIKLMTDGILLQEIQTDRYLKQYSAIIIDEAHERSLNIDFILGYLKNILAKRSDLKIIITSATIDNNQLAKFFNNAPILDVAGKTYPVDIIYQPVEDHDDLSTLNSAIDKAIQSCLSIELGNVLVFLPGEREIKDCINFLKKSTLHQYQILPLFSRQNDVEQSLVFHEDSRLKIILATNVAETSLTIPGIRYVIDSGLARVKRYNSRYKIEQLLVEKTSQASSKQRAGRAGRVSHGICVRLFSEEDFNLRPQFTDPEILRSNLANVILKLISFRLGDPLTFPFLDQPDMKAFNDGFKLLYQLQALDDNNHVTIIGRQMAQIPLDSNLAKILISAASTFSCLQEALIIVSFLAIIDPREVPLDWQKPAQEKHQQWADKQSDFIAILNLWQWYHNELSHKKSNKQLLEHCRKNFVLLLRLREWHELYGQLHQVMGNFNYKENENPASYQFIHQALLSGMLNNVGQKDLAEDFYLGTNAKKFFIHPASNINKPKWLCSAGLVQTSRVYARTNAVIEAAWLVPLTKHLVKYNYTAEHWDKKRGEVIATQATLFSGLLIYQQKVTFSQINPQLSYEIFIKEALIPGEFLVNYPYFHHNTNIIKNLEKLEDKFRTSFVIIEDELFNFYKTKLPQNICDSRSFALWYETNGEALKLNHKEFIARFKESSQSMVLYPNYLINQDERIRLKYIFNHDSPEDGVTALINLAQLNKIDEIKFSWLVPGMIRDKIAFTIKGLPKGIRINFNPVNDFTTAFLEVANQKNDFIHELIKYIYTTKAIILKACNLQKIELSHNLIFHFRVMEGKKILAQGNDLNLLKKQLSPKLSGLVYELNNQYEIKHIQAWQPELSSLLAKISSKHYNQNVIGYTTLIIQDGQVNLTVTQDENLAKSNTIKGFLQLIRYQLTDNIKYLEQKQFNNFKQTSLYLKNIYSSAELLQDCINFIFKVAAGYYPGGNFDPTVPRLPSSAVAFNELVKLVRGQFNLVLADFAKTISAIANYYHQVKLTIEGHPLYEEIELQLDDMVYPKFLRYTAYANFVHIPRYLQAILKRLDKYAIHPKRDSELTIEINQIYDAWYNYIDKLEEQGKVVSQDIYAFKFKIEELRVSLFAQELKTPTPVSAKRLWKELENFTGFF